MLFQSQNILLLYETYSEINNGFKKILKILNALSIQEKDSSSFLKLLQTIYNT